MSKSSDLEKIAIYAGGAVLSLIIICVIICWCRKCSKDKKKKERQLLIEE